MAKITITVNITSDLSEEAKAEMKEKILMGLFAVGQEMEGYAKDECPVDTGRLINSISHEVYDDENTVYVGTNVEYAPYVEYGEKAKHITGNAHFLRNAAVNHVDRYKEIIETFLKS